MKPEADERSGHDAVERVYRQAAEELAERPDPQVRAAVLAAAARAVDAKPRDAAHHVSSHPFAARRWPLSAAALLVVSIMTGLVVTHGWGERPDLVGANQDRREETHARSQAPPQAPDQAPAPSTADTRSPGAIGPVGAEADKGQSARRETESRPSIPRRREPGAAAPGVNDSVTRDTPAKALPDLAGEISSGPTRQKAETPYSNAMPAPADPAAPAAFTQRPLSRSTDAGTEAREKTDARSRAESRAEPRVNSRIESDSPAAWVGRIVKLREAGSDDEADREIARLKQRYPNFAIPREAMRSMGTR